MYKDEIIAEVWRNCDSYAEKHHHSLAEMVADLVPRRLDSSIGHISVLSLLKVMWSF